MTDNLSPQAASASEPRASETSAEAPIFRALLVPYRSLGKRGFTVLMFFLGTVSLVTGLGFLIKGAWPVFGFFGLDVALVWIAFRASYKAARAREEVSLSRIDLAIRKTSSKGEVRESHYNPFWTRFHVSRHDEIGITAMSVAAQGQSTDIGSFLNPDDRESFAAAFNRALLTAKGR